MKNVIDQFSYCLDKILPDNTANCCLNTLGLRYGECKLSREQVKDIAFILAHERLNQQQLTERWEDFTLFSLFFFKWVFTKDLIYAIIITRDNYELQTKN